MKRDKKDKKKIIREFSIPIFNGRLWAFGIMSPYYDDEYVNGYFITVPIGEEWIDEFGRVYNSGDKIFYKNYKKYAKHKDLIGFTRKLSNKAISFELYKQLEVKRVENGHNN